MKTKHRLRRLLCLALTGLLTLSVLWPGLTASASDGLVIDDSGFSDPTIDHTTVYYWREGIPPINADNLNRKFPVLLTWDNMYYFAVNDELAQSIANNLTKGRNGVITLGWSGDSDYSGYWNGSFSSDGRFPHGLYLQNLGYGSGLLSQLPILNFDAIKQSGTTVSFTGKGLPNIIPLSEPNMTYEEYQERAKHFSPGSSGSIHVWYYRSILPAYALEVDMTEEDEVPDEKGGYLDSGGFRVGENYLTGIRRDIYQTKGDTVIYDQGNGFAYTLYPMNQYTAELMCTTNLQDSNYPFKECNFRYLEFRDYLESKDERYANSVAWYVRQEGDQYRFVTPGAYFHDKASKVEGAFIFDKDELNWLIWTDPSLALCHSGNNFGTHGRFSADDDWMFFSNSQSLNPKWKMGGITTTQHNFDCYYGEPQIMDFLQTDFVVENGQVTNLDGPIAIANDTTITVKEGGTLSISGWVVNNGHIVVEPGGTLYLQDNACLNRLLDGKHTGGGVICRGLCIVGENAKLCGGGVEGLQFLAGSHVINFGAVISENFLAEQSYTVEVRDSGVVLYGKGCGVKGSGYGLYAGRVSGTSYPEKGTVETVVDIENVAPNAIYSN